MKKSWTPEVLAYAAGLIDGEGCISIGMTRGRQANRYHSGAIQIGNTQPGMIEWLHTHFGGTVTMHRRNDRSTKNARPLHVWTANGRIMERILSAVLPYLVIKRAQAHVLLALRKTVLPKWQERPQVRLAPGVVDLRERLKQRMHVLNKRGAA